MEKRNTKTKVSDVKSFFHILSRGSTDQRQQRRTTIQISIVAGAPSSAGATLRGVARPRLRTVGVTKTELSRTILSKERHVRRDSKYSSFD